MECVIRGSTTGSTRGLVPHADAYDIHVVQRVAAPAEQKEAKSQPALPPAEQNPKSKIQNPRARPEFCSRPSDSGFWILDFGFWILEFAFCSAGISQRNRRRSRGSQRLIDDARSVHSVTPGADSREVGEPLRILKQNVLRRNRTLGILGRISRPKSRERRSAESQAALWFCLGAVPARKSSWTQILRF